MAEWQENMVKMGFHLLWDCQLLSLKHIFWQFLVDRILIIFPVAANISYREKLWKRQKQLDEYFLLRREYKYTLNTINTHTHTHTHTHTYIYIYIYIYIYMTGFLFLVYVQIVPLTLRNNILLKVIFIFWHIANIFLVLWNRKTNTCPYKVDVKFLKAHFSTMLRKS